MVMMMVMTTMMVALGIGGRDCTDEHEEGYGRQNETV